MSILVQPDGKVLIGGWFLSANGQPSTGIVRLAPDGTTDTNFNVTCLRQTGLGGDLGYVNALALQPDGKIIVIGNLKRPLARPTPASCVGMGMEASTRLLFPLPAMAV